MRQPSDEFRPEALACGPGVAPSRRFGLGLLLMLAASSLPAQSGEDIYVSTGEHGEVSFSDVAQPGAVRVTVETADPLEDPLAELDRRIEQTLTVADALEASRLAREQERREARARARADDRADSAPEVVYQDRYVSPYLFPPARHQGGRPWPHDRPRRPPPEPEPPAPERGRAFPPPD